MIEVRDLWRHYGRTTALKGINFRVGQGTIAGFLGPNGAGKSTTMKILTTFLPPSRGDATVAGHDVAKEPRAVCAKVGYLPESMPIYPELRVNEYLRHRAVLKGLRGREVKSRVESVMDECSIADVERKLLGALSKGYRQRVGLADALLADPEVLILDEPTSGLDPRQVSEVRRLIDGFRGKRTVLLSSHILGEVEQVCDRVIIVADGEIRVDSTRAKWTEQLQGASRLRVVLDNAPSDVHEVLSRLKGADQVECDGSTFWLRSDRDLRGAIYDLCVKKRWSLLELAPEIATLESLFLEATRDREPVLEDAVEEQSATGGAA